MKLTYYGTSSDSGIPSMFCGCRVCEHARRVGGREIRTRSQAVVDDVISLDFPPDALMHTLYGGLDMRRIRHILITHSHTDHLLPMNFIGCAPKEGEQRDLYISEGSSKVLSDMSLPIPVHIVKPFEPFSVSGYTITPLKANHAEEIEAVIYMIESGGKAILWAHDTGLLPDDTVAYIQQSGVVFDIVSLDCALRRGQVEHTTHMDFDRCVETAALLEQSGNIRRGKTRIVLSHITHYNGRTYQEQVEDAAGYGLMVAYDGMTIIV